MNITLSSEAPTAAAVDLLAVGVGSKRPLQDPIVVQLDRAMGGALVAAIKLDDWKGKSGQTLRVMGRGRLKAKRVLLVGLGDREGAARERLFGVKAARAAGDKGGTLASRGARACDPAALSALADGIATRRVPLHALPHRRPQAQAHRAARAGHRRQEAFGRSARGGRRRAGGRQRGQLRARSRQLPAQRLERHRSSPTSPRPRRSGSASRARSGTRRASRSSACRCCSP